MLLQFDVGSGLLKIATDNGGKFIEMGHTVKKAAGKTAAKGRVTRRLGAAKTGPLSGQRRTTKVSKAAYEHAMARMDEMVEAGKGTIRTRDMAEYKRLALVAESYESANITIEQPATLEGILEWQMFEKKMKQKELAKALHISDAKLSLVMSGKQRPDVVLLKNIHEVLGVDGNILLEAVSE